MSEQPQVTSRKRKNSFLDRSSEFKRQKTDADLGTLDVQTEDFEAEKNIENYNYILPHEILLQIFRQFSSSDLGRAAVTCHTWNAACKDDALGWRKVAGKTLKEVLSCYEFRGLKAAGEYTTFEEARKANIPSDLHFEGVLHYLGHDDNKHIHYYMVRTSEGIVVARGAKIMFDDWHSDSYRYTVETRKTSYYEHVIRPEVNLRRIERRVRNGEKIGRELEIIETAAFAFAKKVKFNVDKTSDYFDVSKAYLPQVDSIVTAQPDTLTGVKLHDYQVRAINWMVHLEQERKQHTFSPVIPIPNTYLLVNPLLQDNCFVLPEDVAKHNMTFTVKGGVLADVMGLGKSLEVLGLILKRPMMVPPTESHLFVSKATLICCPNHLVQQWQTEIEKHTASKLRILNITTVNHVKKYTPHDVMNADVVIASYNLLQNKNYLKFPIDEDSPVLSEKEHIARRPERIAKMLQEMRQKKDGEKTKGVVLEHYLWHRIVLDEGHEILNYDLKMLLDIRSTHRWLVSGTPFPKNGDHVKVRKWLDFFLPIEGKMFKTLNVVSQYSGANFDSCNGRPRTIVAIEHQLNSILARDMIWRNTKQSVNSEYEMVAVKHETVLVEPTPLERAIYAHVDYGDRAKACCRFEGAWGQTNEERKRTFITSHTASLKSVEAEMAALNEKHQFYHNKIEKRQKEDPNNTAGLGAANNFMTTYPRLHKNLTAHIEEHKKMLKMFEDLECGDENAEGHTSKLKAIIKHLKELFEREPNKRAIVFSQYKKFLDLIGKELAENDILTTNLKGNVYRKTKGLNNFKADDSEVRVMLMDFKKTASGTNLIEANHIIFADPLRMSINEVKAVEAQAIGRAQRQGQTESVTVVRFLVADSIEMQLHERNTKAATK